MGLFEGGGELVGSDAGGYDECAYVVGDAGFAGGYEVGEAEVVFGQVGALVGFVGLLAEEVEG